MSDPSQWLECQAWLESRRKASRMVCEPIDWSACDDWRFADGALAHRTGRFFSIVGTRTPGSEAAGAGVEQPFILQPEVGLLGFVVRREIDGVSVLVQAKSEPGNVDLVQLAPTVQATVSNYTRVHGGAATPYLELFEDGAGGAQRRADSTQSEQGTRFVGKFNRNALVRVGERSPEPVSDVWSWRAMGTLLDALGRDFAVNTDARSVLVCAPWSEYCPGDAPFARHHRKGGFGEALLRSYRAAEDESETSDAAIAAALARWRARWPARMEIVPLERLRAWRLEADGLFARDGDGIDVRPFETRATDREVAHWCQPLVAPRRREQVVLACQARRGVLHFLLRAAVEPGFTDGVQIGPSGQTREGEAPPDALSCLLLDSDMGREEIGVLQSDEGGRFHHSVARYRVVQLPEGEPIPDEGDGVWVTLAQIQTLALRSGRLTNEARSAISLLLTEL
ncbi:MAG: NDP-hexose 2,3-dehydratase family protein [Myxococcota bacterium]